VGLYIERPQAKATIIAAPGLGCTKGMCTGFQNHFEDYNFLFIDQRGHGESGGPPLSLTSQFSYGIHDYLDLVAAIQFAHEKNGKPIVLHGYCAGAFNSARALIELQKNNLLEKYHIKGLIFDSGWYSIAATGMSAFLGNFTLALARFNYADMKKTMDNMREIRETSRSFRYFKEFLQVLNWFLDSKIAKLDKAISIASGIKTLPIPIFFIHAIDDQIVPMTNSYLLAQSAQDPHCWWIEANRSWHVSHQFFLGDEYREKMSKFLKHVISQ
jgi:pimeloyl-ACP methyl ester carboxylesterase